MHFSPSSGGNDKTPGCFVLHCRYLAAVLLGQSQGVCELAHPTDTPRWEPIRPIAAGSEFLLGVMLAWWSREQMLSLGPTSQGQNFTCSPLLFPAYSGRCFTGADPVSACQSETLVLLNMRLAGKSATVFLISSAGWQEVGRVVQMGWKGFEGELKKQGAFKQHCSKHTHTSRNALQVMSLLL